jgi:HEAT repeat protein
MRMVERDQDSFVRRAAVEALGNLQDPCAITLLRAISEDADRFLAAAAKKSLTRLGSSRDAG